MDLLIVLKWIATSTDTGLLELVNIIQLKQAIEARNLVDLAYGTSSAKTMVLSFLCSIKRQLQVLIFFGYTISK